MTSNPKKFPIGATFGIQAPAGMMVEGFEDATHPAIPTQKDYVFKNEHLRDVLAYLSNPHGDALYLTGPKLLDKRIDLSTVDSEIADFYF